GPPRFAKIAPCIPAFDAINRRTRHRGLKPPIKLVSLPIAVIRSPAAIILSAIALAAADISRIPPAAIRPVVRIAGIAGSIRAGSVIGLKRPVGIAGTTLRGGVLARLGVIGITRPVGTARIVPSVAPMTISPAVALALVVWLIRVVRLI